MIIDIRATIRATINEIINFQADEERLYSQVLVSEGIEAVIPQEFKSVHCFVCCLFAGHFSGCQLVHFQFGSQGGENDVQDSFSWGLEAVVPQEFKSVHFLVLKFEEHVPHWVQLQFVLHIDVIFVSVRFVFDKFISGKLISLTAELDKPETINLLSVMLQVKVLFFPGQFIKISAGELHFDVNSEILLTCLFMRHT